MTTIIYLYSDLFLKQDKVFRYLVMRKNEQGDIIGLLGCTGVEIATYAYDAWGNITSTTHNSGYNEAYNLNHLTYRGYYRDSETGFYYLQSRYYDSITMRFLNVDKAFAVDTENDYIYKDNMFIYCNANPINNIDPTGTKSKYSKFTIMNMTVIPNNRGFSVGMNQVFLDRYRCSYFAWLVVFNKGANNKYKKMTPYRIAIEIYGHAVAYYIAKGIKTASATVFIKNRIKRFFGALRPSDIAAIVAYVSGYIIFEHTKVIDVNNNEYKVAVNAFKIMWRA